MCRNDINIIHLTGNIAKVEPGITTNGNQVANISLAKTVEGNKTVFIDMKAWQDMAERFIEGEVEKGDLVYIQCRFTHDYSKSDNPKPAIVMEDVKVLLTKKLREIGYVKERTIENVKNVNSKLKG